MTNVPGLFAAGECDYQFHGANRLGANSLLSCLYSGMVAGPGDGALARSAPPTAPRSASARRSARREQYARVTRMDGPRTRTARARDGRVDDGERHVIRDNKKLAGDRRQARALKDRWGRIGISDRGRLANHEVSFVRQLWNMLELARVITLGALRRNESRGAHYKPEFPNATTPSG
jgi:succinate dehydrogenase / fumarate reductase flavoprotein subunit